MDHRVNGKKQHLEKSIARTRSVNQRTDSRRSGESSIKTIPEQRSATRWLETTLSAAFAGSSCSRDEDEAWDLLAICQTPCEHYQGDNCALMGDEECAVRRRKAMLDYLTQAGPPCDKFCGNRSGLVRLGIVTPSLLLGGAERWVASLLSHIDRDQIEIAGVLSLQPGDESIESLVRSITSLSVGHEYAVDFARRCDVIVAWGTRHLRMLPRRSAPVVFVSHGFGPWTADAVEGSRDRVSYWAAVSKWAARSFPEEIRDIATIIHNGIEETHCRTTRSREEVRQQWGLEPDEIAIGYVGRMSWEKHPTAIAVAAAELGPPYRPVYVGDGHKLGDVQAVVEQLHPNALFIDPVYPVGDALQAIDVFVLASPSEGFSLGLAEAWYFGVPTVATPVGAIPELMEHFDDLSVYIPTQPTPKDLAEGIKKALSEENKSRIAYAQQVTRENFTADIMGKRWTEYLLEIVNARRPSNSV